MPLCLIAPAAADSTNTKITVINLADRKVSVIAEPEDPRRQHTTSVGSKSTGQIVSQDTAWWSRPTVYVYVVKVIPQNQSKQSACVYKFQVTNNWELGPGVTECACLACYDHICNTQIADDKNDFFVTITYNPDDLNRAKLQQKARGAG